MPLCKSGTPLSGFVTSFARIRQPRPTCHLPPSQGQSAGLPIRVRLRMNIDSGVYELASVSGREAFRLQRAQVVFLRAQDGHDEQFTWDAVLHSTDEEVYTTAIHRAVQELVKPGLDGNNRAFQTSENLPA